MTRLPPLTLADFEGTYRGQGAAGFTPNGNVTVTVDGTTGRLSGGYDTSLSDVMVAPGGSGTYTGGLGSKPMTWVYLVNGKSEKIGIAFTCTSTNFSDQSVLKRGIYLGADAVSRSTYMNPGTTPDTIIQGPSSFSPARTADSNAPPGE
jgi:hypothetical protein